MISTGKTTVFDVLKSSALKFQNFFKDFKNCACLGLQTITDRPLRKLACRSILRPREFENLAIFTKRLTVLVLGPFIQLKANIFEFCAMIMEQHSYWLRQVSHREIVKLIVDHAQKSVAGPTRNESPALHLAMEDDYRPRLDALFPWELLPLVTKQCGWPAPGMGQSEPDQRCPFNGSSSWTGEYDSVKNWQICRGFTTKKRDNTDHFYRESTQEFRNIYFTCRQQPELINAAIQLVPTMANHSGFYSILQHRI